MGLRTWLYKKTGFQLKKMNRDVWAYASKNKVQKSPVTFSSNTLTNVAPQDSILGFVGHDSENNQPAKNTFLELLPECQKHDYLVVTFYTVDNEYADIVKNLQASLEKFSIPYKLVPISSEGAWELNCALKAKVLQKEWEQSDVPIVWIDADATVEENPILFSQLDCDIAFHKWQGWEAASGTVYFAKTELTKKLMDQWVVRCEADPVNWDQLSLHSAWCDINSIAPFRTAWLPVEYCSIFDGPQNAHPVIQHWQASRQSKKEGRVTKKPRFIFTQEGVRQRMFNELWRTGEEGKWILQETQHNQSAIEPQSLKGFDVQAWLRGIIGNNYPLLEVGCGRGAIAKFFKPDEYIGVDINPFAIMQARKDLPHHYIRLIDEGMFFPEAASLLLYGALLYVDDTKIFKLLKNACDSSDLIIIVNFSSGFDPLNYELPQFERSADVYVSMMQNLGYKLSYSNQKLDRKYGAKHRSVGCDDKVTALVFKNNTKS